MADEEVKLGDEQKKGSIWGLLPLVLMMALFLIPGAITGNFNIIPPGLIMLFMALLTMTYKKKGDKSTLNERVDAYCTAAGAPMLILMIMIFLLAGGFSGITQGMGTINNIANLGLSILPPSMILITLFLICNVISFASGTSVGAIVVMLPLVPAIWEKTGLPFGLLLGVLVGGSLFGDNLSFISDTTIIATRSLNIGNKEKFIENIWLVVPAYIITIIAMAFYNVGAIGDLGTVPLTFTSILTMLPYLLVIVLALLGMNVFFVLVIGTIASIAIAVGTGTFGFIESLNVFYNGIPERYIGGLKGMEDVSMWALFVGGTIGLMKNLGGLDFLVYHITKSIKSKKGAEFACVAVTAACSFCITNNTLTSLTAAPICREISDKYKLAPRRVASIVDIFASVVCGLVPYGGFCLMTAGFTMGAVSAIQITPYVWYCWAMGVVALIAVATGYPHFGKKAKAKAKA